jgi:hypothetical protein
MRSLSLGANLITFTSAPSLVNVGVHARIFGIGFNLWESLPLLALELANTFGRFAPSQKLSKTTGNFASCGVATDL